MRLLARLWLSLILALPGAAFATAPVIDSMTVGTVASAAASSTITYPDPIADNDLLLINFCIDGPEPSLAADFAADGWTVFSEVIFTSGVTPTSIWAYVYDTATGNGGTTFNIPHSNEGTSWAIYRISGAADPAVDPPEIATDNTTNVATPDPPEVIPTGGADDYAYLAGVCADNNNFTFSDYPDSFTNTGAQIGGSSADTSTAYASRSTTNTSSQDPTTFTRSATGNMITQTVAIYPAVSFVGGGTVVNPITGIGGAAARPVQ